MKKKYLLGTVLTAVLLLTLILGASQYMLDYSLKPENRGKDLKGSWEYMFDTYPYLRPWVDSLQQAEALKDTFIYAPDRTRLHAYYIAAPKPTAQTAVIVHGYTDNAIRMLMIGYLYNCSLGFNVLLPDLHYSGLSGGEAFQMGWKDRLDVLQWMDVANQLYGDSTRMVVHGISMGAATTMMVSGEPQAPYVKAFVEDCGYTDVWTQFSKELKEQFGLPSFPLMYTADWLCQLEYGWGFREASALEQVKKCHLPMLFIHGDEDDFVPTWMMNELYQAKPQPKEEWLVSHTDHAHAYRNHPNLYTEKVKAFLQKYL